MYLGFLSWMHLKPVSLELCVVLTQLKDIRAVHKIIYESDKMYLSLFGKCCVTLVILPEFYKTKRSLF